jgi:hypothetical protein
MHVVAIGVGAGGDSEDDIFTLTLFPLDTTCDDVANEGSFARLFDVRI